MRKGRDVRRKPRGALSMGSTRPRPRSLIIQKPYTLASLRETLAGPLPERMHGEE